MVDPKSTTSSIFLHRQRRDECNLFSICDSPLVGQCAVTMELSPLGGAIGGDHWCIEVVCITFLKRETEPGINTIAGWPYIMEDSDLLGRYLRGIHKRMRDKDFKPRGGRGSDASSSH